MPIRKNKASKQAAQALNSGEEALKAAEKSLTNLAVKRRFKKNMTPREKRALDNSLKSARSAVYRQKVKLVKEYGLYSPISNKLTRSRKASVNKAWRQLEGLNKGAVFASTKGRTKAQKRKIARDIKKEGGRVTKAGVFLPRSESELKKKTGKLVYDKDIGSYKIIVEKKTKTGKLIREDRYIRGERSLEKITERMQKKLAKLKLTGRQRIRAVLGGANGNVTRRSFRTIKGLLNYLHHYRKDPRALATFMNQATIIVTENARKTARPVMAMNVAKGKFFDPDLYDWQYLGEGDEEDDDE